jgi:hypothetical protein
VLALLAVAVVVVVLGTVAYFYGRGQCPPPDWWFDLFDRSGNFGCLRVVG